MQISKEQSKQDGVKPEYYDIKLSLHHDTLGMILKKLSELPYRGISAVIQDVLRQCDEQEAVK